MKDTKWVVIFVAIGLALAYFVGAPLRKDASSEPLVGTPLEDNAPVYAEGTLTLAPSLGKTAATYSSLFLFVKAPGTPMPIAVKRISMPTFPLSFKLTEANNMAGSGFYDGDIVVVARLDQDGMAGPKQAGDVEASVSIAKGAVDRAVNLVLK